jgi:Flp pilus assembly protein TadD
MSVEARPINNVPAATFSPEVGPPPALNNPHQVLGRILERHRTGEVEEAIAEWKQADLPRETDTWKGVALGAAYLQAGRTDEAEEWLDLALKANGDNAVAHYYVGLLRIAQADRAREWHDAIGPPAWMFIALPKIVPNTRSMYELAAMMELEKAIELAPLMNLEATLAPVSITSSEQSTPTVRDLLTALGAQRYPARAHNALAALYTDHWQLDAAERHIDAAVSERMNAPFAYRELGIALERTGRYEDAARVFMKAFRHGDANLHPAWGVFRNGWQASRAT